MHASKDAAALLHLDELLAAHPCADHKERRDVNFIREFCARQPRALRRDCTPGHVTGSALVLHIPSRRVLLTHHRKLNLWLQFGGHTENEDDPADTALREATEESGLPDLLLVSRRPFDVDVHTIPARADAPEHLHLDLRYLALTQLPDAATASDESHAIRWFTFAECDAMPLSDELRRMLAKASTWRAAGT